jgi:hypothetical protein
MKLMMRSVNVAYHDFPWGYGFLF